MKGRLTLSLLLFLSTTVLTAQSEDAATSKGKAIGETINAAITAALPGVSAIDSLIATLFGKKDKATLTQAQVKAAATTQASTDEAAKSKAANSQLASLQSSILELGAANDLAGLASTAELSMAQARALMSVPTPVWDDLKVQWGVVKANVGKVQSFDAKKLGQISNENVQDAWSELNTQYEQWKSSIDLNVDRKSLALVLDSFTNLQNSVHKIATAPSVELKIIATQLGNIKAQAPPTTTSGTPPAPPPPQPRSKTGDLSTFIRSTVAQ